MAIIFSPPFPLSFPFLVTTSDNNSAMSFFSAAPVRTWRLWKLVFFLSFNKSYFMSILGNFSLLPAKEPKLLHQLLVKYYGGLVTAEVQ